MSSSAVDGLIQRLEPFRDTWTNTWADVLNEAIPDWRSLAGAVGSGPSSRDEAMVLANAIMTFRANEGLAKTLGQCMTLDAAVVLAWRSGSRWYITERLSMSTPEEWAGLRQELKTRAILWTFKHFPGTPIDDWRRFEAALHSAGGNHHVALAGAGPEARFVGYVEDPMVSSLRLLIQQAGDRKSLSFLNAQDRVRRNAFAPNPSPKRTAVGGGIYEAGLPSVWVPQFQEEETTVQAFLRIVEHHVDYLPPLPRILYTEEEPPLFRAYPALRRHARRGEDDTPGQQRGNSERNHDEVVPEVLNVESLLGLYRPNPTVVLYSAGLRACASLLGLSLPILQGTVLVHELGHWLSHTVPVGGRREWELAPYVATCTDVHEAYAQLAAYWTCGRLGNDWLMAFTRLNDRQSAPYHAWKAFQCRDPRIAVGALAELRAVRPGAELVDMRRTLP